jgi:hypothetical protein
VTCSWWQCQQAVAAGAAFWQHRHGVLASVRLIGAGGGGGGSCIQTLSMTNKSRRGCHNYGPAQCQCHCSPQEHNVVADLVCVCVCRLWALVRC